MDGDWAKVYAACPIVCKLADFGLSRSPDMQTTSFLQTRTESTCRGTPVFMAPEIYLENLRWPGRPKEGRHLVFRAYDVCHYQSQPYPSIFG